MQEEEKYEKAADCDGAVRLGSGLVETGRGKLVRIISPPDDNEND